MSHSRLSSPRSISKQTQPASNSTTNASPGTPSPTPFLFGEIRLCSPDFSFNIDQDRDRPLPSIERDVLSSNSSRNTPNTATTAGSVKVSSTAREATHSTPATTTPLRAHSSSFSRGDTPTPSVWITPAPSTDVLSRHQTETITEGLDAMHIRSPSAESPDRSRTGRKNAFTPSRRRRSTSAVNKESHRVEDEDPPATFSRLREVEQVYTKAKQMSEKLLKVLASSTLHQKPNSSIGKLHREAIRLTEFELPSSRIVGLVGDSGVGKSSLINSLLDKKDLARSNNNGSACTCVATEYHYHDRDDFVIQAEYFTIEELKRQYEDLLRAYQENKSPPAHTKQEDLEELERRARLAEETFKASFGVKLQQNPSLLRSSIEYAVTTMLQWASSSLPRDRNVHTNETRETHNDITACSARIRELTSEADDSEMRIANQTSPWPFVRKLKVYLKAYILSKGLIIADLLGKYTCFPVCTSLIKIGLRDANVARQTITERYVLHCYQILAVTRVSRVITDQSVKDVFKLARRAKLSNVHIVCTNSDAIRAKEAVDTYAGERATIQAMQDRIEDAKRDYDYLTEELHELTMGAADCSDEDALEYARLHEQRWQAEKTQANEEFNLLRHIITVRNTDIVHKIQAEYRDHPCAGSLQIFCGSNKIYWKYRMKPASASKRHLELSGIMALRKYCIGMVAESHIRALNNYVKHQIPTLLGSASLWVNLDHWLTDSKWHETSFAAFCRHWGHYATNAVDYCYWNEEAMREMADDMSIIWSALVTDINNRLDLLKDWIALKLQAVTTLVVSADCDLTDEITAGARNKTYSALHTLTATLRHRQDLMLYGIEDAIEDFRTQLSNLRTDALAPIRSAFIGKLMDDTYQAAQMEHGLGCDARRNDIITRRFGSESLFTSHNRMLRTAFRNLSEDLEEAVKEVALQQSAYIESDLELLRNENVILESEKHPEFRQSLSEEIRQIRLQLEQLSSMLDV
ncbi:hypothetical protein BU26DRAFT_442855 [Trematosphaeria pertusa]|uniref:Uncharacterized protein n=1 Tax=Trematosphaeria pertusa TaxID=390896 RepID=A0A6A6HQE4_9PLEO|nr:uncharacterized protein BU26DRAFT_442855 [Trematosphaeria pertusa]KAF2240355.1 hypothetical protein BU26DRAFT_442855 [Trematosphaeria pertusa]